MMTVNYKEECEDIDKWLKENDVTIIKKSNIRSLFNISATKAPAIYAGLTKFGWTISHNFLERPNNKEQAL